MLRLPLAFTIAALLTPFAALSQEASNRRDKPKDDPAPPVTMVHVDRKGMCDGFGRASACILGGGALVYSIARAAGWEGFGFKWDGGKKAAELTPINGGAMFTVSAAID